MAEVLSSVEDLVDINISKDTPITTTIEISTLLADIECRLTEMLEHYDVKLSYDAEIGEVNTIHAKLQLALTNLLANAIKYSDPNKPTRSVVVKRLDDDDARRLTLQIADNGIGIPVSEQEEIFGLRYRGSNVPDIDSESGNGLGLFLTSNALNALGGSISVESTPNEGSTFILTIPKNNL